MTDYNPQPNLGDLIFVSTVDDTPIGAGWTLAGKVWIDDEDRYLWYRVCTEVGITYTPTPELFLTLDSTYPNVK